MLIKECVFADGVSVADIELSQNLYLENNDTPVSDYTFGFQRCGEYGCEMRLVVIARNIYPLSDFYTTRKAALIARHKSVTQRAAEIKAMIAKES